MPRDWMTDEERKAADKQEKWTRLDAWAIGILQVIIALVALRYLFS